MSKLRLAGFSGALVVAALVGGTVLNAVAAAPSAAPRTPAAAPAAAPTAATTGPVAEYCETYRAAFAKELGVTEDALKAAAKKALAATIDKAVADGDLAKAAADRLKARVQASTADGCKLLAGWGQRIATATRGALGVVKDGLAAAAKALDLPAADVKAALKSGKSLKDLATAQKVDYATVSAAIVAAVKADLDKAVAAGTIKQAREDRILDRLTKALADGRLRPATAPAG
jgi:ribosomal protein S20